MARPKAVTFVLDVLVVVALGMLYVAGLSVKTLLATLIRAGRAVWPSASRERTPHSHGR